MVKGGKERKGGGRSELIGEEQEKHFRLFKNETKVFV